MKENSKMIIKVFALLLIALLSIFVCSKPASSAEFHGNSIQLLDNKKVKIVELTAATAGAATAIALIPGDATTPIANQIAHLSSYLLIVVGAIFLEKSLLTLTGYITFNFIIPIACLLGVIYLFSKKKFLKGLSVKLATFGIVIFLVIPVSIQISNIVENTYKNSIDQTIEEANYIKENAKDTDEESTEENTNWWDGIMSNIENGISSAGNAVSGWVNKAENMLSKFIDAIAVFVITSCVIPILVILSFIWITKIIFGFNIPIQDKKNK